RAPDHLVIVAIPGVTWTDLRNTKGLVALRPGNRAIAALSARTASRTANIERSYLTLGAGDPGYALIDDPNTELAFQHDDTYEGGKAAYAVARRTGYPARGEVVQAGVAALRVLQRTRLYGAEAGLLGEELRNAHITRGV